MVKKKIAKKVVTKLDEFKRKKYKPFTKEHLATFHRLENRSQILKPKKIKRKKGEINIIALPPKKFKKGGLLQHEGGVVPNKKGEFIAIGCGKIMGNRRKTTKIR
jgi:hypothetical protein